MSRRVAPHPLPGALDADVKRCRGAPAQYDLCPAHVENVAVRVHRSRGAILHVQGLARDAADEREHVVDGHSVPAAQVEETRDAALDSDRNGLDEVSDVEEVANDRAIPPDRQWLSPQRSGECRGDQAYTPAPELALAVGVRGPKDRVLQAVQSVEELDVLLGRQLDDPVGGEGVGRMALVDQRPDLVAIDGPAARHEDDPATPFVLHCAEQAQRPHQVARHVLRGLQSVGGWRARGDQVNHDIRSRESGPKAWRVEQLPMNLPDGRSRLVVAVGSPVEDAHLMPMQEQGVGEVRTDEAVAAEDANSQDRRILQPLYAVAVKPAQESSSLRRRLAGVWWRFLLSGPRLDPKDIYARPTLGEQIGDWRQYLRGRVLNAGAGDSDISPFVEGEVLNQDLPHGLHNGRLDYASPLHQIPVADGHFDAIFCNAVLEHVENPAEVMVEFARVCRPGGYLYISVPFLQPEHKDPTDYQRYTEDGLRKLVSDHGFDVVASEGLFSVYHTLAWIAELWLSSRTSLSHRLLRELVVRYLRHQIRHSTLHVPRAAAAHRVLGRRR